MGVSGGSSTVKFGWWATEISAGLLSAGAVKINLHAASIAIPRHPQAENRGNYLNYSPYSQHILYIPPLGSMAIDPSFFDFSGEGSVFVNMEMTLDIINGTAICIVKAGNHKIGELSGQVGVPVQIAQVGSDILGTAVTAIGGIGNTISGGISGFVSGGVPGAIAGAIGKGAESLYNTIEHAMPQVVSNGLNGSFAGITSNTASLVSKFFTIASPDDVHRGRPVCRIETIGSYSGFVQCAEGDISISGTEEERDIISANMQAGFFYE